ncbi:MAG: mechanosensitive ion channel [Clostridiales bacterium]|nr:mechanosensitive ion channel [Clostridiales bacterium]
MEILTKIMEEVTAFMGYSIAGITVGMICKALIVLFICLAVAKIVIKIVCKGLDKNEHIEKGLHTFIKSVVKIVVYFIVVLIVAETVGIPITSLVALFSVVGVAVSLSIQGALSNLASGVMLFITKPFESGDFIDAAGISGTVEEIRLTYTKLITPNNQVILVPNSEMGASKVVNYSAQETRRFEIKVTTSYDAKIQDVKDAINKVLTEDKRVLTDPAPFVRLSEYKDSSIEYTVRGWAKLEDYWDTYFDVLENIKYEFDNRNIEMTYNHLNVHMMNK